MRRERKGIVPITTVKKSYNQVPGITPQLNSTKFAAIEMMNAHQHSNNLMRPTSSRVGNFLSSDKPSSDDNIRLQNSGHQAYVPSNLPTIESNGTGASQELAKINTNGLMVKPPLSSRGNPVNKNKRATN